MTITDRYIGEPRRNPAVAKLNGQPGTPPPSAPDGGTPVYGSNGAHPAAGLPEEANGVITGDLAAVLPALREAGASFDIIIADPPYNIGKDFGNNQDLLPVGDYIEWTRRWVADCFALLAAGGLIYIYGFPEILARVAAQFPIDEQRWLVWHYTNKTVPASSFWQRSHESILCLWKPGHSRPALEIDQIREPYTSSYLRCAGRERKGTPSRFGASGKPTTYHAHENGALPRDVIKVPALAGGAGRSERWFVCRTCDSELYPPAELSAHRKHDTLKHPTQKPMELTRRLLRSKVNGQGGKALIPFAGSGSECVAAQELGIDFLGIEINPEYAAFARQWIQRAGRGA